MIFRPRAETVGSLIGWLVLSSAAPAAGTDARVEAAVERGVVALRRIQEGQGAAGADRHGTGATALVGLTLLECGAAPEDSLVAKMAEAVRADCVSSTKVYTLSVAIMFLDRLGDPLDVPLIQAMTVRLLEGQFREGGWSYQTPEVADKEIQRLRTHLQRRAELRTSAGKDRPATPPLDPDLEERLRRIDRAGPGGHQAEIINKSPFSLGRIDNSNTQFAILGLWAARRHQVPLVDVALLRAAVYFQRTHHGGTWYYSEGTAPHGHAAMTCAGLIGLAVGTGVVREARLRTNPGANPEKMPSLPDVLNDPLVQTALNHVGRDLIAAATSGLPHGDLLERDYYFLWSVERVGVIYSLSRMGGVDWYGIGARLILLHQDPNRGTWTGRYGPEVDTCFALLFLKRANLTRDLTSTLLKKKPTQTTLKAGGGSGSPEPEQKSAPTGEAEKLRKQLANATSEQRTKILEQLREGKGPEYTDALLRAIGDLTGEPQRQARDALAERMSRMTAATLREKLKDRNAEMRRAAALGGALKDEKSLISDLITALDDSDGWVVRAVGVSLQMLTGQKLGPSANATPDERAKAVAAWKAWWKQQNGR